MGPEESRFVGGWPWCGGEARAYNVFRRWHEDSACVRGYAK
jgi:hypothetical protein